MENDSLVSLARMIDIINTVILLGGVIIACWAILSQRATSAKRAALDFVTKFDVHSSPEWSRIVKLALQAIDNRERWQPIVEHRTGSVIPTELANQKFALFTWLNHMELIAAAVHTGALDRDFYLRWYGQAYKRYWNRARQCVFSYRDFHTNASAFKEFQKFAESIETE